MATPGRQRVIYTAATATIVAGIFFLSMYPTKIRREEADMHRIVNAVALEGALEQYLLQQTRAQDVRMK